MNSNKPVDQQQQQQPSSTKKGHGNRKDQRFRKKCRNQGIKPGTIEKLLTKQKQKNQPKQMTTKATTASETTSRIQITTTAPSEHLIKTKTTTTSSTSLQKRKRDISSASLSSQILPVNTSMPKSTSSISIVPPVSKKMKEKSPNVPTTTTTSLPTSITDNAVHVNYRFV